MRAIKFRAWDKENGRMLDWGEVGKVLHTHYFDVWVDEGGFVLMQYTGLKDKNGQEIYEGDIIKYRDAIEGVTIPGIYYWEADENPPGPLEAEKCEVLGNIYENPELLL